MTPMPSFAAKVCGGASISKSSAKPCFSRIAIFRPRGPPASRSQVHMTEEGLHMRKMLMLGAATAAMMLTHGGASRRAYQDRRA